MRSPRRLDTRGGAIWRIGTVPSSGKTDRKAGGRCRRYRHPVRKHEKSPPHRQPSRVAGREFDSYATLVVVVIVSVIIAVSSAVLSPVGDIVAKSVLYPIGIICHIDYSILVCPMIIPSNLASRIPPPAGNSSSAFVIFFSKPSAFPFYVVYMDLIYCAYICVAN